MIFIGLGLIALAVALYLGLKYLGQAIASLELPSASTTPPPNTFKYIPKKQPAAPLVKEPQMATIIRKQEPIDEFLQETNG